MKITSKRQIIVMLILGGALLFPLTAQSKTAVLDASLGGGIHPNASAIVADTLNEQFVKSPKFIAIDRAYVSSIQSEKQFQLSGEVSEEDIKDIGETFGADYLCIANVSLLGATYTVSARLIEVETAQVVSQESHRARGQIDILFEIAEVVGAELTGAPIAVNGIAQPRVAQPEAEQPKTVTKPAEPSRPLVRMAPPVKEEPKTKGRVTISYMIPGYIGNSDVVYPLYETDQFLVDTYGGTAENSAWGVDFHSLVPSNWLYYSLGLTYTNQNITHNDDWYSNFNTVEFYGGLGGVVTLMQDLQLFAGFTGGIFILILGEDYDAPTPLWTEAGAAAAGISFGLEGGADYFLGSLCLSAKLRWTYSGGLTGDEIFTDSWVDPTFGQIGLMLGGGFTL